MNPIYKCIIAEKSPSLRKQMLEWVSELDVLVVDTPITGKGLIESFLKFMPDFIITNIELGKIDGLAAYEKLKERGFNNPIIFCTQNATSLEYSKGFELGSIDFINIPIQVERFLNSINKAKRLVKERKIIELFEKRKKNIINVSSNNRTIWLDEDSIVYVEKTVERNNFDIHLIDGRIIKSGSNLKSIRTQCSDWVIYPHRSFLVNTRHIKVITPDPLISGNYLIELLGHNRRLPLTRRRYDTYLTTITSNQF